MSDKNPIDELFKHKLEGHKIKPTAGAWAKIESATQGKTSGFKPMYLMRAAVVVLLIGVSGWVYFQSNTQNLVKPTNTVSVPVISPTNGNPETQPKSAEPSQTEPKVEPQQQSSGKENTSSKGNKSAPNKAATKVPVLKMSSGSSGQKVYNVQDGLTSVEELENEPLLSDEASLNPTVVQDAFPANVKIKLKFNKPVSQQWASETATENKAQPKLKDKVLTYASNQFENLKTGKKLELPKTPKGKPQLEINLDKIFN